MHCSKTSKVRDLGSVEVGQGIEKNLPGGEYPRWVYVLLRSSARLSFLFVFALATKEKEANILEKPKTPSP